MLSFIPFIKYSVAYLIFTCAVILSLGNPEFVSYLPILLDVMVRKSQVHGILSTTIQLEPNYIVFLCLCVFIEFARS